MLSVNVIKIVLTAVLPLGFCMHASRVEAREDFPTSSTTAAAVTSAPAPLLNQERPQQARTPKPEAEAGMKLPGPTPDGFIQLPNQWFLRPAGESIPLGDFPAAMFASPDRRWAAVLHCGWGQQEVRMLDLQTQKEVSRASLSNCWVGAAWSKDGSVLYVSGGSDDVLLRYPVKNGKFGHATTLTLPVEHDPYLLPAGPLAAQLSADHLPPERKTRPRYPAGMGLSPDGHFMYVAETYADRVVRVELPSAKALKNSHGEAAVPAKTRVLTTFEEDAHPYRLVLGPAGQRAFVSLWGSSSVAMIDLKTGAVHRIPTDPHPNEMVLSPDASRLFVACANSNFVDVIDTNFRQVIERLNTALYPGSPDGSTPNALALSKDGKTLITANADNNNLVLFDVSDRDESVSKGYIPTGWYPTGVVFGPNDLIASTSGKGDGSLPNLNGPMPGVAPKGERRHIAGLLTGTAHFVPFPDEDELSSYTRTAHDCSPLRKNSEVVGPIDSASTSPIPLKVGDPSPIRYCVYIIKENRTYDQVLGDMPEGNGDPDLCLFGEDVTPNHHALARQFVLLDNFYCDAEVSADGHEWSTGAYATDYVERGWPPVYGRHGALPFPAEGQDPNGTPEAGHLWDRAREAGITYRSYGEWVAGGTNNDGKALAPALVGHIDPRYPQFNMEILEETKAAEFVRELKEFETSGTLPQLIIIRLPNDHTVGTRRGWRTPRAFVAEHDQGLGTIIEELSRTRFWKEMAVFVVEDDAQNGSDHVDAHRTVALLAGPFVKRGYVDHTLYSTTSMLRTMELILGLAPMSQFDAAARPMFNSFTSEADETGFTKRPPRIDLTEKNGPDAPLADLSAKLNFKREDANPDIPFNEIIWKSVKGAASKMPPPVRAAFVRPVREEKDED